MTEKKVAIEYEDLMNYMHLLESEMWSNKIRYNELRYMESEKKDDSGGRAQSMQFFKEQNKKHRDTWFRMNMLGGKARGFVEVFNATKRREINSLLC